MRSSGPMRRARLIPLLAITLTCRDATGPGGFPLGPPGIRSVGVVPHSDSVLVGDTIRLQVFVTDSSSQTVANPKITWKTTDTSVLSVDATGLITARLAGTAAVIATVRGVSGGAFVTAQWPVVTVSMPESLTITRYEVVRFLPGLEGPTGAVVSDRSTSWTTTDSLIAKVTSQGVVTPAALGTVFIGASSNGHKDSTRLTIVHEPVHTVGFSYVTALSLLVGQQAPVDAFCNDSLLREVTSLPITWQSSDTSLMTVLVAGNDREPTVHALRPGALLLRIACGGLQDSVPVSIGLATTSVHFFPETVTVAVGQVVSPNAVFTDSAGGTHGFEEVSLQSLDTTVVSVSNVLSVLGRKAGQARLVGSAVGASFSDTAVVRVVGADNLRITFGWAYPVLIPNYSVLPGMMYLRDTAGMPLSSPHTVMLSSSDTAVARIAPTSVSLQDTATVTITYGHPGDAIITARVDSLVFTQGVTSQNVPAAHVTMAGRPPRVLQVGDTVQLGANVFGTDQGARFYPVTWTVSPPSRARVDMEGTSLAQTAMLAKLTALGPGQVTVRASSGGFSDSVVTTIRTVTAPTISTVTPSLLSPGATVAVTGSGFDPNPANDSVWVDGIPVGVLAATTTSLSLALPPQSSFRCGPTHQALINIGIGGAFAVDSALLRVGLPESLDVGGLGRVGPGAGSCVELSR